MIRKIEHTGFARRPYADVCRILDRHGDMILEMVSSAAARRSVSLIRASDDALPGFDHTEQLRIRAIPFIYDTHHASVEFTWDANSKKRLLANVDTRIDIRPLVRKGPAATTELILRARYEPDASARRSPEMALFGRRVVRASLHQLLETLIATLEEYEESIFD